MIIPKDLEIDPCPYPVKTGSRLRRAGLQAVEVRDRLVYDCCQIEALYRDELADATAVPDESLRRAAQAVDGKVWSAMFYARKPAG